MNGTLVVTPASRLRLALAFFAVYILWGSTFLAIRVAVAEWPPLYAAGVRFTLAGGLLWLWSTLRSGERIQARQWRGVAVLGALMFLITYSALFWAEKSVPSGVASVLGATLPLWTVGLEWGVLRTAGYRWRILVPVLLGLAGVAVLVRGQSASGEVNGWACAAILGGEFSWAVGSVLTGRLDLPKSKALKAGGQMLTGGILLLMGSLIAGEMTPIPRLTWRAVAAVSYLITAGSLAGFTAYVWLLGRMPAGKVASYAYVNPVVALALGHWLAKEPLGIHTWIGATLVLASVAGILRMQR